MFNFTAKLTKKRIVILIVSVIIPLILVAMISADISKSKDISGDTAEKRSSFLLQFGWQSEKSGEESKEIMIPAEFNKVYISYNDLQKSQKFDLTPYKGRLAKCYTIKILNYPENSESVYAALIVCDGKIIGGDVHSVALDGFMHGFDLSGTNMKFGQYSPPETIKKG